MGIFKKKKKVPEKKRSRVAILNTQYGTARWSDIDYDNFAKETYLKNIISFRCIDLIGKSMATVPWAIYDRDGDSKKRNLGHPMNKLLDRPNPEESWNFLMLKNIAYLLIAGNSYMERITLRKEEIPKEMYVLRPDKMKIVLDKNTGEIAKYVYNDTQDFLVDDITKHSDILHNKFFNPLDDFYGTSITEPAAREIDTANEAVSWQKKMLENEGRPGMVIMVEGSLSDKQYDRLERDLKDKYSGSENSGKSLVLESDFHIDAKPYNWSPQEMDFIETNRELSRRISYAYGVPPQLIGIPGDSTYSNYKEARQAFWEDTLVYYLYYTRDEMNNWIFSSKNAPTFLDFDINDIPALASKREILWERAQNADFLTVNEKRKIVGLDTIDGGEMLFVPAAMVPLTTKTAEAAEEEIEDHIDENMGGDPDVDDTNAGGTT